MPVQALLFDMDGTLIDSMPLHQEAWRRWHERHALEFDEDGFFEATAGRTNREILAALLPHKSPDEQATLGEEKEALYRDEAVRSLEAIAGAHELLAAARDMGLKLAVCTAAPPDNIDIAFDKLELHGLVDTLVYPAQGFRGKPHPDLFLEAARRLEVSPESCIVFEDAPLGLQAAQRAGMRAVALTTTLPADAFAGFANLVSTHADFTSFDLATLVRQTP